MAILRASDTSTFVDVAATLASAGVSCIEVTLTTPGALASLKPLRAALPADTSLGVGTVITAGDAEKALSTGADFLVTPTVAPGVVTVAAQVERPVYVGAFSPSEIASAWQSGATAVKVFPAATSGPEYIRQVLAPLPDIRLIPTGGVKIEDAADYIRAGSVAVGVGGPLMRDALSGGSLKSLAERAKQLVESVAQAKECL